MQQILIPVFLLFFAITVDGQSDLLNEFPEPLAAYVLQVGDQELYLDDGKPIQLEGNFENPTVKLTASKHKTFEYGNVSFDYPIHFAYQVEGDDDYRLWTLDGNDFVISVFEFQYATSFKEYTKEIIALFGKSNCVENRCTLSLGNKVLKGKRIKVNLVGESIILNFMEIPSKDGKSHFIGFQDLLDEEGKASEESKIVLKLIKETILYNPRKL